jgi:hypothetical protein
VGQSLGAEIALRPPSHGIAVARPLRCCDPNCVSFTESCKHSLCCKIDCRRAWWCGKTVCQVLWYPRLLGAGTNPREVTATPPAYTGRLRLLGPRPAIAGRSRAIADREAWERCTGCFLTRGTTGRGGRRGVVQPGGRSNGVPASNRAHAGRLCTLVVSVGSTHGQTYEPKNAGFEAM